MFTHLLNIFSSKIQNYVFEKNCFYHLFHSYQQHYKLLFDNAI